MITESTNYQMPKGDKVPRPDELFERQERSYLLLLYRKHKEWFERKMAIDKREENPLSCR
jgi:hypothetical protein